jgi:hypothetical protein
MIYLIAFFMPALNRYCHPADFINLKNHFLCGEKITAV